MGLSGRIALVTGAANGIGAEIAGLLAKKGAKVILTDIKADDLKKTAHRLLQEGRDVESMVLDVGNEEQIVKTIQKITEKFGSVDILVNNAGISPKLNGKRRSTHEIPSTEWEQVLNVNLKGVFLCTRESVPSMIKRKWGRIVNISSQAGRTSSRIAGAHYSASKSGVIGFTRTFATEYAEHGITANCVAPGRIETEMGTLPSEELTKQVVKNIPVGRLGRAEDVASVVAYLCSEDAGYINGATIDVNGGLFMS